MSGDLNWGQVFKLARFHRVQGLLWNAVAPNASAIPPGIRDALSSDARKIAADSLRVAAESLELRDDFAAAAMPLVFLKGSALGSLAYKEPALKTAIDIDLLIDPADIEHASRILRGRGYRSIMPADENALRRWHRRSKESVWSREQPPFQIDLHTRAADNPRLIPDISVHSPVQLTDIGLRTFAPDEMFSYLAVHGASSTWFRLKWISDFAAFLHPKESAEIRRLYDRSQEIGAGRAAGQALLLADRLFATLSGDPALSDQLRRERVTHLLAETAFSLLSRNPSEPTEHFLGTMPMHLTPFLLRGDWRYKLSEFSGQSARLLNRFAS